MSNLRTERKRLIKLLQDSVGEMKERAAQRRCLERVCSLARQEPEESSELLAMVKRHAQADALTHEMIAAQFLKYRQAGRAATVPGTPPGPAEADSL